MDDFEILALFPGFPGRTNFWDLGWGAVYLIKAGRKNILLDCGGPAVTIHFKEALSRVELTFDDIDMMLISHFHWDHVYNCRLFPKAEFIFSKKELEYTKEGKDLLSFVPALDYVMSKNYRLITHDGEYIEEGIKSMFVPGHTPGSLAFVVENKNETWVLTGDAIKNRAEVYSEIYNSDKHNLIASASIRKIKDVADVIAPGHDGIIDMIKGTVVGSNDVIMRMPEGLSINGFRELNLEISGV